MFFDAKAVHRIWLLSVVCLINFSVVYCVMSHFRFPAQSWSEISSFDESIASLRLETVSEVLYKSGGPRRVYRQHNGAVLCVCIDGSTNGDLIYSGGHDKIVKIWAKRSAVEVPNRNLCSAHNFF